MTITVTGKGDFARLQRFSNGDFTSYELYIPAIDELVFQSARTLPDSVNIVSIHTPSLILVNGKSYPFDLGQVDPIGSVAVEALRQTIELAKQVGARVVVVHGASHNTFLESSEEGLQRVAHRVRSLIDLASKQGVTLCFETDVLWHNLFYSRRALLARREDFVYFKKLLPQVKITADFEHLSLTYHFEQFVAHCGGEGEFLKMYSEVAQRKFEVDCQEYIKKNFSLLQQGFKEYLSLFFDTFRDCIEHIHINGSDPCNYLFNPKTSLPFLGEHLALGLVEGEISDKFDYTHICSLLNSLPVEKQIYAVLEIWCLDKDVFLRKSLDSKRFLEHTLSTTSHKINEQEGNIMNTLTNTTNNKNTTHSTNTNDSLTAHSIFIRGREIKDFGRPFIIAEIGMNHNGDVALAKNIIDAAKEAGADCAKFQSWTKSSLFSRKVYEGNAGLEKDIDVYSFGAGNVLETYRELKRYCDQIGIIFSTSVFNEVEADFFLDELNMDFVKIASMDLNNFPFLEYVAKKNKPMILSTGLSTLPEIAEAVQVITKYNTQLVILHCLSVYPDAAQGLGAGVAGEEKGVGINLNNIEMLRTNFGCPVGFSDNAPGVYMPLGAAAKGACVIEKHFTIDKNMAGWDHTISADVEDMKMIVEGSRLISAGLGRHQRVLSQKEMNMRSVFRRSVVLRHDLPAGQVLKREDLDFKRPGTGIEPKHWTFLVGRALRVNLKKDDMLKVEDLV